MKKELISVCICTYKRTALLAQLLDGLTRQHTGGEFTFEAVIVDNDALRSAEETVKRFQTGGAPYAIIYDCEPVQSISLARNRTVRNAAGAYVATIDDDEAPAADWLHRMYSCLKAHDADGVLGPVLPHFPQEAPPWLVRSGLCNRPRHATGTPITLKDLRTGNTLLRRGIFEEGDMWFDPAKGLTGGSDAEFLIRQIRKGRRFVWCDDAVVFETVPEERWPDTYYLKRHFRVGTMVGEIARRSLKINLFVKFIVSVFAYSGLFLLTLPLGKHVWMRFLTRLYYNFGGLASFFKTTKVPQRQG